MMCLKFLLEKKTGHTIVVKIFAKYKNTYRDNIHIIIIHHSYVF